MTIPVTPYKIKKGILYWKHFGTREFLNRLMERMEPEEVPYGSWFPEHRADEAALLKQRREQVPGGPRISVAVPAWHTPERFLVQLIDSLGNQSYANWELVIADAGAAEPEEEGKGRSLRGIVSEYAAADSRIRYVPLPGNGGIAENTNAASGPRRANMSDFWTTTILSSRTRSTGSRGRSRTRGLTSSTRTRTRSRRIWGNITSPTSSPASARIF